MNRCVALTRMLLRTMSMCFLAGCRGDGSHSGVTTAAESGLVHSCQIREAACPDHPDLVGTFEDVWGDENLGAASDPAACMRRASDYYNWCGGAVAMNGETTTATYYTDGQVVQSVTVGAPTDAGASETIGGGTLSSPAVGPPPAYGIGGSD